MLLNWNAWLWIITSPLFLFVSLFIISQLFYYFFFRNIRPTLDSGMIIMALGFFVFAIFPIFNIPLLILVIINLELLIIWLYMVFGMIHLILHAEIDIYSEANRLSIGTWVSATAIIAELLMRIEYTLYGFILLLGFVAILLWLFYLFMIAEWLVTHLNKKSYRNVNGKIFLVAISTLSIVLILDGLFGEDIANWVYLIFIFCGLLFYLLAFCIILTVPFETAALRPPQGKREQPFALRRHTKCAVSKGSWAAHGAFNYATAALFGQVVLNLNIEIPSIWISVIWWWSFVLLCIVELYALYHFVRSMKTHHWKVLAIPYDVFQWAHLFALAVFYTFTWSYYHQHLTENKLVVFVANEGIYIVCLVFLIELMLFLSRVLAGKKIREKPV